MMTTTQKTMKRTVMLFAATLLALVFFSGVALAVTKSCVAGVECLGTRKADTLNGSDRGDDIMYSGAGDDHITGNSSDNFIGTNAGGADTIFAGGGDDTIHVDDGSGDDVVDCGDNIIVVGGSGNPDNDTVLYDAGDQIGDNCEMQVAAAP